MASRNRSRQLSVSKAETNKLFNLYETVQLFYSFTQESPFILNFILQPNAQYDNKEEYFEMLNIHQKKAHLKNEENIDNLIKQKNNSLNPNGQIEQLIKEQKLREARKLKSQLEDKLISIEQNIYQLNIDTNSNINKSVYHKKQKSYNFQEKQLQSSSPNLDNHPEEEQKKRIDQHLKQLTEQRIALEKQRQNRLKSEQEKLKEQELLEQQKLQLQREDIIKKRKQEIEKWQEDLIKKQKEREVSYIQRTEAFNQVKNQKPLYLQIEERFKNTIEKSQLEQKKNKLLEIRNLHKPLDFKEIEEHEKKHQQKLKELSEQYATQGIINQQNQYIRPQYISEYYKKIEEEYKVIKNQDQNSEIQKKNNLDLRIEYAKNNIKVPKISDKKKQEREDNIQKLIRPSKNKQQNLSYQEGENGENEENTEQKSFDHYKLGLEYLKFNKSYVTKFLAKRASSIEQNKLTLDDEVQNQQQASTAVHHKKHKKTASHSVRSETPQPPIFQKFDYLKNMRQGKKNIPQEEIINQLAKQWEHVLNNKKLNDQEKNNQILIEAEKLEEIAKRKQKLLKVKGNQIDKDEESFIDQYYINAIKAKLAVLHNNESI